MCIIRQAAIFAQRLPLPWSILARQQDGFVHEMEGDLLVSIALVFLFAQYGELFLASLAAWIGLCNFAARAMRNFTAYGFLLAGYTVAILGCSQPQRSLSAGRRTVHGDRARNLVRGARQPRDVSKRARAEAHRAPP